MTKLNGLERFILWFQAFKVYLAVCVHVSFVFHSTVRIVNEAFIKQPWFSSDLPLTESSFAIPDGHSINIMCK